MLRVTIEIVPRGLEARARVIARGEIVNDGSGTFALGNYTVALSCCNAIDRTWRTGSVRGFPRLRLNAWRLLAWALEATLRECGVAIDHDRVADLRHV